MSLFLSQIEPDIKRELYRRIDISSFDHPSSHGPHKAYENITESVKRDISRHWYSIRKPWIRFTSGALVGKGEKFEGTQIYQEYEEESAMKNVLFGGILNSETFNESTPAVASNREPYYRAKKSAFKGTGLRGAFDNTYIGERKVPIAGITGITVKNKGDLGSIREAEIKWTCFDDEQFDKLQQLYMTPGITCLLEWGWSLNSKGNIVTMESKFFDFELNPNKTKGDSTNPYEHSAIRNRVMAENGCYDACVGMVNNFDWTFNKESGAYDCTTKITAPGDALLGMELSRGDETVTVTEITGDTWFKPETFQPYMEKGLEIPIKAGATLSNLFGFNKTVNLENDIKNLAAKMKKGIGKASWVGNMLNCTPRASGEQILDIQKDISYEGEGDLKTQTTTIGSNIRVLDHPEISRYNSWKAYTERMKTEQQFLNSINNKGRVTGAFWFDAVGWNNDYYVTWAFIEEILINQFFCPRDANDSIDHKYMMLRSCNVIDVIKAKDKDFYTELIDKHDHERIPAGAKVWKVYESVRIGMNPNLRSADGTVMYIPHHPPYKGTDGITRIDTFSLGEILKGDPKRNYEGYLRNVLVNIKAITASFKDASTLEDGLKSLLGKMNSASCDYWNLVLQCDELDGGTSLKVIDSNWVDKSMKSIMDAEKTSIEDIPFTFPVYSNNTILSDVNISSKLPDSLKNAIFLGGSQAKKGKSKDGDNIGKLSDKVIDRYYHFGPNPAVSGSVDKEKEAEEERKLAAAAEKKKEEEKDVQEEISDASMIDAISSKARNYIINLLETENSPAELEHSQYKNNRILPVDLSIKIDGIAGIYFGNVFTISKLPLELKNKLLFQVKNVSHTVDNNTWTTNLTSICRITDSNPVPIGSGDQFVDEAKRKRKGKAKREYKAEEKRRAKAKARLNANNIVKVEKAARGKDSNAQADGVDAQVKAISGATDPLNVDNKFLDVETVEEESVEGDVQVVADFIAAVKESKKEDNTESRSSTIEDPVEPEIVVEVKLDPTPQELEILAGEEARKIEMFIRIPWLLSETYEYSIPINNPTTGLPATEIEESGVWMSQEAKWGIVKNAKDAITDFRGYTSKSNIDNIINLLEQYRSSGRLLLFLQVFHLEFIRLYHDSNNGNIFTWIDTDAKGMEWDKRAEMLDILEGVEFLELPGSSGFRKWNTTTVDIQYKIDPVFAWGPQGKYETGVYYRHGYDRKYYS